MKKLMKGNEAIAEAAIQAGCRYFFGYPITPQNQIPEYMSKRLPQVGGCFLQAESEVAAINMVYGAGGAGARVMTSSSSPGISLKQEGISYIVGAEVPCVIVNMVRGGPGLGSIQPAQSDYYQATRGGGHGDYRMCVLAPGSVQEAVDLTQDAFDIADRYRNPVLVLGDGLIGQMMEPVDMDRVSNRAPAADLKPKTWAANGHVPTAERPRAIINSLYIDPQVLENHNKRLQQKFDLIAQNECRWQEEQLADAEIVIIAYGTTSRIARSAMRKCREKGIKVGMLRPITLWPFPDEALRKTLSTAKDYLVLEMSAGQMVDDVRLAVNGERPVHFYGRTGGMVPTVGEAVLQIELLAGVAPEPEAACACDFTRAMDDAAQKLSEAADVVGQKLDDAGKKVHAAMNSPEFKEKAQAAVDQVNAATETMGKMLGEMGQKIHDALTSPEGKEKAEEAAQKVNAAAETVGEKLDDAGQKIHDAFTSPEWQQKAEDAAQKVNAAAETVGEKLNDAGQKIHDAFTSPEWQQKAEDAAQKVNAAAETVGEKLNDAGQKIHDTFTSPEWQQKAEDAAQKVNAAAETVGEKLNDAGQKISDTVNRAELQQKAQDVGKQVSDFATRTAETVTKGVAGLFGAIGKAFENVHKDLKDIEAQQKAAENKPTDENGKEGE